MIDSKQIARRFLVLAAALIACAGPASAAPDDCVSANVPGPIVLPDGTFHPSGRIRVCLTEQISPVAGLHEASVAGLPVGMFLSRVSRMEATPESYPGPLFQFIRTDDGVFVLEAYSIPSGKRVNFYRLRETTPMSPRMASTHAVERTAVVLAAGLGR